MIAGVHGGAGRSMHDSRLFTERGLLQDLEEKMNTFEMKYSLHGDSGHGESAVVRRPISTVVTFQDRTKREQNKAMSSVRQAVEWGFKEVSTKFAFTVFKKQTKLFEKPVNAIYRVAFC